MSSSTSHSRSYCITMLNKLKIALKNLLTYFSSSKVYTNYPLCNQIDLGFGHFTTGILAEEISSGGGIAHKTYQFRCPSTLSNGWVTGAKTGGVMTRFDCCGKIYCTFTAPQLERILIEEDQPYEV